MKDNVTTDTSVFTLDEWTAYLTELNDQKDVFTTIELANRLNKSETWTRRFLTRLLDRGIVRKTYADRRTKHGVNCKVPAYCLVVRPDTSPKCYLDLDGVLTDFVGELSRQMSIDFFDLFSDSDGAIKHLDVFLTDRNDRIKLDKLLNDRKFWENLPFTNEAPEILSLCEEWFGDKNVYIFSDPAGRPEAAAGKLAWVIKRLPGYVNRFLLGHCKYVCSNVRSVLIDDNDDHIKEFERNGGYGILVPRPWNTSKNRDGNWVISYIEANIRRALQHIGCR